MLRLLRSIRLERFLRPTEDFRVFQVLELNNLRNDVLMFFLNHRIMTAHLFCWWLLRLLEVKKVSNGGSGIDSHYSGSHRAPIFERFVKTDF